MSAEPTPRPWHLLDQKLRPQFSTRILEIQAPDGLPIVHWSGFDAVDRDKAETKANAEFICRAANHHQLLVDALEQMLWMEVGFQNVNSIEELPTNSPECVIRARDALLKTRGES